MISLKDKTTSLHSYKKGMRQQVWMMRQHLSLHVWLNFLSVLATWYDISYLECSGCLYNCHMIALFYFISWF